MTPQQALDRIAALCDALDREVAYEEDGLFVGVTYSTAKVRAILTEFREPPHRLEFPFQDPLDAPCHSCGARAGEPCQSPSGDLLDTIHATRGAPA